MILYILKCEIIFNTFLVCNNKFIIVIDFYCYVKTKKNNNYGSSYNS